MNPWLLLGAVLTILAAFTGGVATGKSWQEGQAAKEEVLIQKAAEAAQLAAAEEISKIEVRNVTIKQKIERETLEVPVYRDCSHTDAGLRVVNEALSGGKPAGDSRVPGKSR